MKKDQKSFIGEFKTATKKLLIKTFNNDAFESGLSTIQHKRKKKKRTSPLNSIIIL